jgi:hypothetical protein
MLELTEVIAELGAAVIKKIMNVVLLAVQKNQKRQNLLVVLQTLILILLNKHSKSFQMTD